MPEPLLPIFLDEHGDITAFYSVLDAERYVEPIDVHHHEYIGYDAKGYRLQLSAAKNTVTITLPDNSELRAADLEQALRRWLLALGDPLSLDTKLNLSVLVNYCAARAATR